MKIEGIAGRQSQKMPRQQENGPVSNATKEDINAHFVFCWFGRGMTVPQATNSFSPLTTLMPPMQQQLV
jgi:hypothetical protein